MKRLFLLRHAKAGFGPSDQTRPLSHRGKRDALWLGHYLKKNNLLSDHILCSSVKRTMETYDQLRSGADKIPPAYFRSDLYLASADHIFHQIQSLEPEVAAPMIIGHNPGMAQLFQHLAHNSSPDLRSLKYPTCCLGILDFDIGDWSDLKRDMAQVFDVIIPSDRIGTPDKEGTL